MNRMGRFYLKSGLVILFSVFCILFGVSLASNGVERVYGPMDGEQIVQETTQKNAQIAEELALKKKQEAEAEKAKLSSEDLKLLRNHEGQTSLFGSIGNGLGQVIKSIAQFVVSIFSGIFDLFV